MSPNVTFLIDTQLYINMPSLAYARDLSQLAKGYATTGATCASAGGKSCYHLNDAETIDCQLECNIPDSYIQKAKGDVLPGGSLFDLGLKGDVQNLQHQAKPLYDASYNLQHVSYNIQNALKNFAKQAGGQFLPCPALGKYGQMFPIPCWLLAVFAILGVVVIAKVR
jgi:hypothetical protein